MGKPTVYDLVEALRCQEYRQEISDELEGYSIEQICQDAADEIERLQRAQMKWLGLDAPPHP